MRIPRMVGLTILLSILLGPGLAAQQVPDAIQKAQQLYLEMKGDEALALVNDYLLSNPADPDAALVRALVLARDGRDADVLSTIEKVENAGKLTFSLRLMKAESLGKQETRRDEAIKLIDELILADPTNPAPRISLARIFGHAQDYRRALSELGQARQFGTKIGEAWLITGEILEALGRHQDAGRIYSEVVFRRVKLDSIDPYIELDCVAGLARCFTALNQYDQAIELYGQILTKRPNDAAWHYRLGVVQGMRSKFQDAINSLTKAVELEPDETTFKFRLADLYRSQKRMEEAIELFEELAQGAENPYLPALRLGELYLETKDLPKAEANAKVALELAGDSAEANELTARVRKAMGDTAGAIEAYKVAISKDSTLLDAMYQLALLLSRSDDAAQKEEGKVLLGRYRKVEPLRADIERVSSQVALSPSNAQLLTSLAALYNNAEMFSAARVWVDRSLRITTTLALTHLVAAHVAYNLDRTDKAIEHLETYMQMLSASTNPAVLAIGELLAKLKAGEEVPKPLLVPISQG